MDDLMKKNKQTKNPIIVPHMTPSESVFFFFWYNN